MEENNVLAKNSNEAKVVAPDATQADPAEETVEEIRARLEKAEELVNNYKIRAEKAEKVAKPAAIEKKSGDLSSIDMMALMKASVAEEDIDEVVDYAKFKGISVSEALNTSTIKATLAEKSEQRTTAIATNTGAARRGSAKVSDDALLSNASAGKFPESDEEITRLVAAKAKQGRR